MTSKEEIELEIVGKSAAKTDNAGEAKLRLFSTDFYRRKSILCD